VPSVHAYSLSVNKPSSYSIAKKYAEISGGKKKAVSEKKPKAEAPKAEVKADKPPAEPAAPVSFYSSFVYCLY